MSRSRLLALATAILGAACSTTTVGHVGDPSAQRWLADHADAETTVATTDRRLDQRGIAIESISPTEVRFRTLEGAVVPIETVRQVTVVQRGRGTLEGALLGIGIGAVLGYIYGLTSDLSAYERSMDCTIVCNHSDAANLYAIEFGVLGLLAGTLTGVIVGHRDILELR
jgi:hypothetical protein